MKTNLAMVRLTSLIWNNFCSDVCCEHSAQKSPSYGLSVSWHPICLQSSYVNRYVQSNSHPSATSAGVTVRLTASDRCLPWLQTKKIVNSCRISCSMVFLFYFIQFEFDPFYDHFIHMFSVHHCFLDVTVLSMVTFVLCLSWRFKVSAVNRKVVFVS